MEPDVSHKYYAPGVGMIKDDEFELPGKPQLRTRPKRLRGAMVAPPHVARRYRVALHFAPAPVYRAFIAQARRRHHTLTQRR